MSSISQLPQNLHIGVIENPSLEEGPGPQLGPGLEQPSQGSNHDSPDAVGQAVTGLGGDPLGGGSNSAAYRAGEEHQANADAYRAGEQHQARQDGYGDGQGYGGGQGQGRLEGRGDRGGDGYGYADGYGGGQGGGRAEGRRGDEGQGEGNGLGSQTNRQLSSDKSALQAAYQQAAQDGVNLSSPGGPKFQGFNLNQAKDLQSIQNAQTQLQNDDAKAREARGEGVAQANMDAKTDVSQYSSQQTSTSPFSAAANTLSDAAAATNSASE